jgi:hypothetical protein
MKVLKHRVENTRSAALSSVEDRAEVRALDADVKIVQIEEITEPNGSNAKSVWRKLVVSVEHERDHDDVYPGLAADSATASIIYMVSPLRFRLQERGIEMVCPLLMSTIPCAHRAVTSAVTC